MKMKENAAKKSELIKKIVQDSKIIEEQKKERMLQSMAEAQRRQEILAIEEQKRIEVKK